MINKRIILTLLLLLLLPIVYASTSFVIKNIRIDGLQGISSNTVMNYLPVRVGSTLDTATSNKIIQDLFKTGFFDDIALSRQGDTLVIKVKQRPIIGKITITGNKIIPTKKLMEALQKLGFSEGQIFNQWLLTNIKTSLAREYFVLGKYNAQVNIHTKAESRNRVSINIDISEGKEAKIHQISIVGNHAFSERTLVKQFKLTTSGLFTFFTNTDQYSREKLDADLETLHSFYTDRGYLKFRIDSSQVSISPDRKQVYILVHITEGAQYKISGYRFEGKTILPESMLKKLVSFQAGQFFSRKEIVNTNKRIGDALGNKGYANANVDVTPQINEKDKTAFLIIKITPGPRIYVRHIRFSENYRTNDEALRRQLIQLEGAVLSTRQLDESKRNLLMLPFLSNAEYSIKPVVGKPNQVDVDYKVTEVPAAEMRFGIAYSQLDRLMITASVNETNLLGTGNTLGVDFMNSRPSTNVSLNYYNPFYTKSGIGRSLSVYTTRFNSSKANITDYAVNDYGASVGYNFPMIAENNFMQFGYGYENNLLDTGSTPSKQMLKFTGDHGHHFYQLRLNGGWSYQGFDRILFPTQGLLSSFNISSTIPISKESLELYKLTYSALYYHPLYKDYFIGQMRFNTGFGNGYGRYGGTLPFFRNFYSGGVSTVRGYEANTLGPRDSNGDPIGGNFELDGSAGLIFPNFLGPTVRTSLFVDTGNVYQTDSDKSHYGIDLNRLRYSTGLEVDWRSPVGVLNFSLAKALHKRRGDDTEVFQFNIGTTF